MQHQQTDAFLAPFELKFVGDAQPGVFEGYGSVFNSADSHGDVIVPGAFTDTLAEYKAKGTMPGLYAEHSPYLAGGDPLPIGVWTAMEQDDHGLRVKGKISALDTDNGRRIRGLMMDGAIGGLSIAFQVPPGGAVIGKKAGEPKRTLKSVILRSVDIVRDPSHPAARVDQIKTLMATVDHQAACQSVAACLKMHVATMSGNDSPTADERTQMLQHLKDAHTALTGEPMPHGMKSMPTTIREFEKVMRELGYSISESRALAAHGFKSATPRDEEEDKAITTKAALGELGLGNFSLPKF